MHILQVVWRLRYVSFYNINNNIFAGNTIITTYPGDGILTINGTNGIPNFTNNTIIDNNSFTQIINSSGIGSMNYNTIVRNNFLSQFTQCKTLYFSGSPFNFRGNNLFNNYKDNNSYNDSTGYEFYNTCPRGDNINATYTWWGTTSGTVINMDSIIYDYSDNGSYSVVNFYPHILTTPDTAAPITPPVNVVKANVSGGIKLTWNPNAEADLKGYKVFWGSPTGYSFSDRIDVGNVTSYILSGLSLSDTIAVTAYDGSYNKDTTTLQNQLNGHESWYTNAYSNSKPIINFTASDTTLCKGNSITFTNETYFGKNWKWLFPGGHQIYLPSKVR